MIAKVYINIKILHEWSVSEILQQKENSLSVLQYIFATLICWIETQLQGNKVKNYTLYVERVSMADGEGGG